LGARGTNVNGIIATKIVIDSAKNKRSEVNQMELETDEQCCVCYETMNQNDNLSYCKFGCGRNIHTECMERWVKHKVSNSQEVSCPLCRKDWGRNALEDLKTATKHHKDRERERKMEESKIKYSKKNVMAPTVPASQ
jgi:hypothetical protein